MPVMNFDLEDGKPPVTFTLKEADTVRFMAFMAECNRALSKQQTEAAKPAVPEPLPVAQGKWLTEEDMAWLIRFSETCEDSDSGGYDVPKDRMRRLAEIGVVRSLGFGRYETTAFGNYVVETHFEQKSPLPLLTYDDHAKNAAPTPPAAPKEPTTDAGGEIK
jgi:hypothetical protein